MFKGMRCFYPVIILLAFAASARGDGADLSVTISDAPDPAVVGSNITFTMTVWNNGPEGASDVVLSGSLPSNAKFQSLRSPEGWACSTPPPESTGSIDCAAETVISGGRAAVAVVVKPVAAGIASTMAAVAGAEPDADPDNNTARQDSVVLPSVVSQLKVRENERFRPRPWLRLLITIPPPHPRHSLSYTSP